MAMLAIACGPSEKTQVSVDLTEKAKDLARISIIVDGDVECWGSGSVLSGIPAGKFAELTLGDDHACGILPDRSIVCWGDNSIGQAMPPDAVVRTQAESVTSPSPTSNGASSTTSTMSSTPSSLSAFPNFPAA